MPLRWRLLLVALSGCDHVSHLHTLASIQNLRATLTLILWRSLEDSKNKGNIAQYERRRLESAVNTPRSRHSWSLDSRLLPLPRLPAAAPVPEQFLPLHSPSLMSFSQTVWMVYSISLFLTFVLMPTLSFQHWFHLDLDKQGNSRKGSLDVGRCNKRCNPKRGLPQVQVVRFHCCRNLVELGQGRWMCHHLCIPSRRQSRSHLYPQPHRTTNLMTTATVSVKQWGYQDDLRE